MHLRKRLTGLIFVEGFGAIRIRPGDSSLLDPVALSKVSGLQNPYKP